MRAGPHARHGRQDADPPGPDRRLQRDVLARRRRGGLAREIIAAFALPENAAKGVITVDGKMVERLHLAMAERVAAIAEAIS